MGASANGSAAKGHRVDPHESSVALAVDAR